MELLGFIDQGAAICVPEEAAELRKKDDEQHWHQRREKNAWLMGCAHVIREYDLAAPIEVFAKITILVLSLPVLSALLQTIRGFLV